MTPDDRVLTTLTDPLGHMSTWYVYDAASNMTDTTDRNGRRTTYSYDIATTAQSGETWVSASPAEIVTYTYDADSRLTNVADANATLTYTYDGGSNVLTARTSGPGTGQPAVTITYAYDTLGHLIDIGDSLSTQNFTTYVWRCRIPRRHPQHDGQRRSGSTTIGTYTL